VVQRGSVSAAVRRSGGRRRQRWGPGARGRREEGEGHGHLARRTSRAALTGGGEGEDGDSGDNPGRGGGTPVTGRG
jgi:hypothetical protein